MDLQEQEDEHMGHQSRLFYEDIYDAIGTTIMALGGYKKVGYTLWPNMKMESAYARLKNCVDPSKPEKLAPDELATLIREGKKAGCNAIPEFISDDAGYERPVPKNPEDELATLQREFIASVKKQEQIAERIERVVSSPLRAV